MDINHNSKKIIQIKCHHHVYNKCSMKTANNSAIDYIYGNISTEKWKLKRIKCVTLKCIKLKTTHLFLFVFS